MMRKMLSAIPALHEWLERRQDTRLLDKLEAEYGPKVDAANKAKDWDKAAELDSEWGTERDLILHPTYALTADRLTAKARKYGIRIPDKKDGPDAEDWERSNVTGDWMLAPEAERLLRIEITQAARGKNDEWRKWLTLFFAVIGTILAAWSVFSKQKQPDACPQNYYRNESGACVFAAPARSHASEVRAVTPAVIRPPSVP
jgi:hypothetical protein